MELIIAAVITAVPAAVAAWHARGAKRIVTGNGQGNLSVMSEETLKRLGRIETRMDVHDLRHLAEDDALATLLAHLPPRLVED